MNIITPEDPRFSILNAKTQDVLFPLSIEDKAIIVVLTKELNELGDQAAGIAANQLGYSKNIFLAKLRGKIRVFINTKVMGYSNRKQRNIEGCLSLPNFNIITKRPYSVTIEFFDENGNKLLETHEGKVAQVLFHEINHCKGLTLANDFNKSLHKQTKRTAFGMKLTSHRRKIIAIRRAKKKFAKEQR